MPYSCALPEGELSTPMVHHGGDCTILMHALVLPVANTPVSAKVLFWHSHSEPTGANDADHSTCPTIMSLNRFVATTALQLLVGVSLPNASLAQAPIIDRSDGKTSLDGARLGAANARSNLQQSLTQQREADERVERATSHAKAAQAELDAARAQRDAAVKAVEAARKAEADANTALERALRDRK